MPLIQDFREFTDGEIIVSVVNYKDMIVIATHENIYIAKDGKLQRLMFEVQEKEE